MQAAVIASPRRVEIAPFALPALQPGQIVVRIAGTGICGSNLPVWQGRPWFSYPLPPGAPGHEPWGRVSAVGPDVDAVAEGDAVTFLCERAFAEEAIVDASQVVRLPASMAEAPFPGEPIACAINVMRRTAIHAGDRVAVVGIGFLGALLVQLACAAGADVVAFSRRSFALDLARRCGAREVRQLADGASAADAETYDCVIEAVGEQPALDLASRLVRERGRLIIAGYHQDGDRHVDLQSWNWRGLDVINAHERDPLVYLASLREAVGLVGAGTLDPRPLLTHFFPLAELDRALDMAVARPDGFMKALVTT